MTPEGAAGRSSEQAWLNELDGLITLWSVEANQLLSDGGEASRFLAAAYLTCGNMLNDRVRARMREITNENDRTAGFRHDSEALSGRPAPPAQTPKEKP